MSTFLIIGAGKVAKHFHHYLSLLGHNPLSWNRTQNLDLLQPLVDRATHVLLAISDSALEGFYRAHLAGFAVSGRASFKTVVHFSGAASFDGTIAAHPLMTFGPELYDLEIYRKIHFVVSGADALGAALPGFPNSFSLLEVDAKPLYHALCVMGGNFPVILWQKMFSEFLKLGIPAEAAGVYLQTVLRNTLLSPGSALTGPLARRDVGTIGKNLDALTGDPFQNVYRAFVGVVAPDLLTSKLLDSPTSEERLR